MSFQEMVIRTVSSTKTLFLPMYITLGVTVIAAVVLLLISQQQSWPNRRLFSWVGLFYGISGYNVIRLSTSWVKLITFVVFLLSFQELSVQHYLVLILCIILYSIDMAHPVGILTNVLSEVPQILILLVANITLSYIKMIYAGVIIWIFYVLLVIFIMVYAYYLFMNELRSVSQSRRIKIEDLESEEEN